MELYIQSLHAPEYVLYSFIVVWFTNEDIYIYVALSMDLMQVLTYLFPFDFCLLCKNFNNLRTSGIHIYTR